MSLLRWAAVPCVLVAGVLAGLAAVLLHRTAFPAGLLLGALTTVALVGWALGCRRRWLATVFAVGWLAVFLGLAPGRPEGDLVVASDGPGYALILVAGAVAVAGLAGLAGRRSPAP